MHCSLCSHVVSMSHLCTEVIYKEFHMIPPGKISRGDILQFQTRSDLLFTFRVLFSVLSNLDKVNLGAVYTPAGVFCLF